MPAHTETMEVKRWDTMDGGNVLEISEVEFTDNDRVFIRVNDIFDVKIVRTDEGIVIDVMGYRGECDPIATTYAFDTEAVKPEED